MYESPERAATQPGGFHSAERPGYNTQRYNTEQRSISKERPPAERQEIDTLNQGMKRGLE